MDDLFKQTEQVIFEQKMAPVDTALICEEYTRRPGHLYDWSFGRWFATALAIIDGQLIHSVGMQATKLYILHRDYNRLPDVLVRCKAFNDRYNGKERKS